MTDVPDNRIPLPKPEGYDPHRYELLLRYIEAGGWDALGSITPMPNRKTDTNNNGGVLDRQHRHELRLSRRRLRHPRARSSAST